MFITTNRTGWHSRHPGSQIFIFNFRDEKDFEMSISCLRQAAYDMFEYYPDTMEEMLAIVEKLESRTSDRFATKDVALSEMLFTSEMAKFTQYCLMTACVYSTVWFRSNANHAKDKPQEIDEVKTEEQKCSKEETLCDEEQGE